MIMMAPWVYTLLMLLLSSPWSLSAFQSTAPATLSRTTCRHNAKMVRVGISNNPMDELDKALKAANAARAAAAEKSSVENSNIKVEKESSAEGASQKEDKNANKDDTAALTATTKSYPTSADEPGSLAAQINDLFTSMDLLLEKLNWSIVKSNVVDGSIGERGEGYTATVLFLFVSIVIGTFPLPYIGQVFAFLGGPGLMLAGGALILAALNDLGDNNLTPFLAPVARGELITDGIYSKIRHPIYAGLMCLCAGFSILTTSAPRLVLTAILILLLNVKSDKEEEKLMEKYPEYAAYRVTTGKFYPGDWSFREDD
ncbi:Isoprenylcysteine carboxyl methyltransferase (ICMT) family [Seminavis robusta]|uniref:Isoprenylcysteine carboxyl methyltransferase (ICMT) family n=1 Tax=Seminavis robusta TaxID=568900 RepID=A0A9N8DV77_9STRA|nr:Isoprenylcysteine carboxyl methyltransferase (ICMT) family [Seminavis robusta]|eukprot:Sro301_g111810.1 Isoprenylcysteine carboxyl methyltransferase (ICMT) family (314) ;mRNA; r:3232-4173